MLATDSDALECDLMETYGIMNYRELPISRVALFAVGLRENSRIKMKYNGCNIDFKTQVMALILDGVNMLVWSKTKDAERGRNKPSSLYERLMSGEKEREHQSFRTPEEFMEKWNSL